MIDYIVRYDEFEIWDYMRKMLGEVEIISIYPRGNKIVCWYKVR